MLSGVKNYYGHVDKASLSLLGKSLNLKGFYIDKKNLAGQQTRFISAETITIGIDRTALLKGFLVTKVSIDVPWISYIRETSKTEKSSGSSFFKTDIPIVITKVEIANGQVEYVDITCQPIVEVKLNNLQIVGTNLSNTPNSEEQLPTEMKVTGRILNGDLNAVIKADLSQEEPTFDINAEVKDMNLVQMNNFFKAYGKFDVNKGTLSLFTEVAAKEGKFKGYLKPEVLDLDVVGSEDYSKGLMNMVWQTVVGVVAEVFQNQKEDELATKIPFSGTFKTPHANVWFAVAEVLYNAFVQALKPSIDYEININSVKKKG